MLTVRWLGAAGLELVAGHQAVLIDPYLTRPGKARIIAGRLSPNPAAVNHYLDSLDASVTAIVAGHTHFDHALDIPSLAARVDRCAIIGSRSLDNLFRIQNLPDRVTVCQPHRKISVADGIRVTMIPSAHGRVLPGRVPYPGEISPHERPPLKSSRYRLGDMYMPRITMAGTALVHAGSAGYLPPAAPGTPCDVLFMCVPGWHRDTEYTRALLADLAPRMIIPFHYDDFTRPLRSSGRQPCLPFLKMSAFVEAVRQNAPQAKIRFLRPLEELRL